MNSEEGLVLGGPVFLRNLVIYPIRREGDNGDGMKILTVDESVGSNTGGFSELDTPVVDEVVFNNSGDEPVMMLDGEEIMGAMQNRIIAASNMVEAGSAGRVPVVCVEEKRWDRLGGFRTGDCSYPHLRSILAQQDKGKGSDTQQLVWQEIERKLTITRTSSATSSMHDIYDKLEDEIGRYTEGYEHSNHGAIGLVGCAGGRILAADIFTEAELFRKFEKKLIRSYALDAMEYQQKGAAAPDVNGFLTALAASAQELKARNRIANRRVKAAGYVGQALLYNGKFLHLSAFPSS